MTPLAISPVAYHESGHGVVALALDLDLRGVSVVKQTHSDGQARLVKTLGAYAPWRVAIYVLAGGESEHYCTGVVPPAARVANDMYQVSALLDVTRKASAPPVEALVDRYRSQARAYVILNEAWIRAVAAALMQRKALSGDEVLDLQPGLAELRR